MSPNQIQRERYPALTLAEVYATITYYLHNKEAVDAYIAQGDRIGDAFYQEWLQQEPSLVTKRLRELKRQKEAEPSHE
jgi:hypothetical protein